MKLISSKSTRNAPPASRSSASAVRGAQAVRSPAPSPKPNVTPAPKRREPAPPAPAPLNKKSGKKSAAPVFITLLLLVVVAGGLFGYAGITAQNSTAIYPNISAYGIKFGGYSVEQAVTALESSPTYSAYRDAAVTVEFPAGQQLRVEGKEAGLYGNPNDTADRLYAYGRGGNFFANAADYISCVIFPKDVDLDLTKEMEIDKAAVMSRIEEVSAEVNRDIMENTLNITDDSVTIIKGASGVLVDIDEIYKLVETAFQEHNYNVIEYQPFTSDPKEVDLSDIMRMIYRAPESASYDNSYNIIEEVQGITFDQDKAQRALDSADYGEKVVIPLIAIEPEYTRAELEGLLFRDILAEKTTTLAKNATRSNNVELAAKAISELVLLPGDVFSYNETVGERTRDKGYGMAPAYVNGETVDEIGGGICQVSSTIYYCTLMANLEIVERTAHMFAPSYVPLGMDATVSWGGPNFRFKNNTEYPLKIISWRDGDNLNVQLMGTKSDDTYVKMTYDYLGSVPFDTTYVEDAGVAPGETKVKTRGSDGSIIKTFRTVYAADGTELSRKTEATSRYKGHKAVILVPVGELAYYVTDGSVSAPPLPIETPIPSENPDEPTPTVEPTSEPIFTPPPSANPGTIIEPTDAPTPTPAPTPEPTPEPT
ncbi:MAG: VanW family protein, partial [Oscillospiraceae bacterium]|nr:VanW family protein [Oscillospiraceae bacterium]